MSSKAITQTPERWNKIQTVFHEAEAVAPEEREAWVRERCGDDDALRRDVEAMLAASSDTVDTISDVIGTVAREAARKVSPHAEGDQIGPYRLVRVLGHGGMGSVYLAERADEQFQQQVAIKLIHSGLTNPDMLLRFRSERQILANLSHPNIAHLVDGGNTSHGVPYLVMEYIDGEPFLDYCNARGLDVDARLALFAKVCAAVHYAHQNLVVHRDIKPSNILVTADGSPRLLDFGIAKLLGDSARHTVAVT
ncbi:MAG: serine/threonine-protein kinase, partial [Pseudomonadota bacterium]